MGVTSGSMQRDLKKGFDEFKGSFEDFLKSIKFKEICEYHNKTECVLWALNIEEFAERIEKTIPDNLQKIIDKIYKEEKEDFLL